MKLKFDVKDKDKSDPWPLSDFDVYIDGTKVEDDKKTYVFGSTFKYVVKKAGYGDSTEMEHTVVDAEPNKIEVQLERKSKVSQKYYWSKTSKESFCVVVSSGHHSPSQKCQAICEYNSQ